MDVLFPVNNFPHVFGKHVLHLVQRGWVDSSLSYLSTYIHLCSCIPSPESAFVCGGGGALCFSVAVTLEVHTVDKPSLVCFLLKTDIRPSAFTVAIFN